MRQRSLVAVLTLILVTCAFGQTAPGTGKKLIFFGWGYPSPQWLADNTAQADDLGFDGVCLDLGFKRDGKDYRLGWLGFGGPHFGQLQAPHRDPARPQVRAPQAQLPAHERHPGRL